MADVTARIRGALEAVSLDNMTQSSRWTMFCVAVGRAQQAAESGDTAAVIHWLNAASGHEYDLTGSCDHTGAVLDELEADHA